MAQITKLTPEAIAETRRWAQEALQDDRGPRWREVAPLVLDRVEPIINQYEKLAGEVNSLRAQVLSLKEDLAKREEADRRFEETGRAVFENLRNFADRSLPFSEMISEASRKAAHHIIRLETERDELVNRMEYLSESIARQENEILRLTEDRDRLESARSMIKQLEDKDAEAREQAEVTTARIKGLEDAVEAEQARFEAARRTHEEEIRLLREELEDFRRQGSTFSEESSVWHDRALAAEARVNVLNTELKAIRDRIRESLGDIPLLASDR